MCPSKIVGFDAVLKFEDLGGDHTLSVGSDTIVFDEVEHSAPLIAVGVCAFSVEVV